MTYKVTHRVVIIILYDEDSRILLQQRTDDALYMPGMWAYFGGSIDEGESPEEAVRRETLEEVNYNLIAPVLLLEQGFILHDMSAYMHVYVEKLSINRNTLVLNEGKDWGWYNFEELPAKQMNDRDIQIATRAFNYVSSML
jgi:8-oxo-dGTP diphosphatase